MSLVLVFVACAANNETKITPRPTSPASMNKNTRELFQESMYWHAHFAGCACQDEEV
jgi:hypothetical protein